MRKLTFVAFVAILLPTDATAQDDEETSIDIEVGSTRIGGPGLSEKERAASAAEWIGDDYVTEETLPPKGDKKRIPALHTLAKQYYGGRAWKDACEKYDLIIEEWGDEALDAVEGGKKRAAKSFFECAHIEFTLVNFDKAERILKKSERYGPSDHRHAHLRRKMLRDSYKKKLSGGDIESAMILYNKYQAQKKDEDERIWMGAQLADRAWAAFKTGDKVGLKDLMAKTEEVAPMNTEYRHLKEKVYGGKDFLSNALMLVAAVVGGLFLFGLYMRWRNKRMVVKAAGGEFGGLDDEL